MKPLGDLGREVEQETNCYCQDGKARDAPAIQVRACLGWKGQIGGGGQERIGQRRLRDECPDLWINRGGRQGRFARHQQVSPTGRVQYTHLIFSKIPRILALSQMVFWRVLAYRPNHRP
jgi:hypothetical protein